MQVLVGGQASTAAGGAGGLQQQQQQDEQEQQVRVAAGTVDLDDEHVFLYKLVPGVVASSYGVSQQGPAAVASQLQANSCCVVC